MILGPVCSTVNFNMAKAKREGKGGGKTVGSRKDMKRAVVWMDPSELIPYERNTKAHSPGQIALVAQSIDRSSFVQPIVVDRNKIIIIGHCRREAAIALGMKQVPVVVAEDLSDVDAAQLRIADNRTNEAPWQLDTLRFELHSLDEAGVDIRGIGFPKEELGDFMETGFMPDEVFGPRTLGTEFAEGKGAGTGGPGGVGSLSDRFLIPPFSVFNAREGWWQNRKRAWIKLGIKSEVGRGNSTPPAE